MCICICFDGGGHYCPVHCDLFKPFGVVGHIDLVRIEYSLERSTSASLSLWTIFRDENLQSKSSHPENMLHLLAFIIFIL